MKTEVMDEVVSHAMFEEGFSAEIYLDHLGNRTIGYGTNLEEGISETEAEYLLRHRLMVVWDEFINKFGSDFAGSLPDSIQAVMLDLAYNMGLPRLTQFERMFTALRGANYSAAADELLDSRYAEQVPNRAVRNANKMRAAV